MVPIKDFSDLRGAGRLTIDAITATTDLVEQVHYTVASAGGLLGDRERQRTSGIAGLVYRTIRGVSRGVGAALDLTLEQLSDLYGERASSPARDAVLAALNGVVGDHLSARDNPLAIRMQLRRDGQPVALDDEQLKSAIRQAGGRVLLMVHGLCMNDRLWERHGHDHGQALAQELGHFPLYLFYNSGLHISANGRLLTAQLQALSDALEGDIELTILGHSMGGLVVRSGLHYAAQEGHAWPRQLSRLVFLGTPHQGAPLERGGNWLHLLLEASAYSAPFARLGRVRSAGVTDLRYGNLLDEDWHGRDRFRVHGDSRAAVPLPEGVSCYAVAASLATEPGTGDRLLGDGLVALDSALGRHADPALNLDFPPANQWVVRGINHLALLDDPAVYNRLRRWLDPVAAAIESPAD